MQAEARKAEKQAAELKEVTGRPHITAMARSHASAKFGAFHLAAPLRITRQQDCCKSQDNGISSYLQATDGMRSIVAGQ